MFLHTHSMAFLSAIFDHRSGCTYHYQSSSNPVPTSHAPSLTSSRMLASLFFLKKVPPSTMASHSANFNHRSGITISHQSFLTNLAHSLYHSRNTHTCISFSLRRSRQLLFEITLRRRKESLRRFTHDDHP